MIVIRQIFALLALVTFLFSNNGITIYENKCPISGQVRCEYFFNNCCCSGESGSGCCETTINLVKFIPNGFFTSDHFQAELANDFNLIPFPKNVYEIQKIRPEDLVEKVVEYPPPNFSHGRQLLIELETFII
jgi:hypothetical protein